MVCSRGTRFIGDIDKKEYVYLLFFKLYSSGYGTVCSCHTNDYMLAVAWWSSNDGTLVEHSTLLRRMASHE